MANKYIHETVSKFARGVKRLLLIGALGLLASCGGDSALQAEQVQTFNKQVIKRDTERHSLLSSLYSTAKVKGGVTTSGKVVTNAELLAQNPAVLKMVGAEKTLAKPQRVQAQTLVSSTFSPVFRIQNGDLPGSYFFTIYESERVAALAANPNWSYEGPAFYTSQTEEGGLSPVWRFRNLINGSYVFTIYESERQSIVNDYSTVFAYEGVSWYARQTEALGYTPLYRFRNITNGTYLFSAYESEKVAILENYAETFVYEGVAYYVQVPGGTSATPPAMQVTNQSAVLKPSVITGIDASLTKVDQIGNFTSAAGRTWAKDQVFMHQGRAYKVVGVIVNADGTTSLSTSEANLDDVYDDLSFTFKANALAYDSNQQPKNADQITSQSMQGQAAAFANSGIQPMATPSTGIACLIPKGIEEGKVTTADKEWGYAFALENCNLRELLRTDFPIDVNFNGQIKNVGEIYHKYDKARSTNYTETNQSSEANITVTGSMSTVTRNKLKALSSCKEKNAVLECEWISTLPGTTGTVFFGPVPVTYQVSIGFIFTVDISGKVTVKYLSSSTTKKGYLEGVKIDISEATSPGGNWRPIVEGSVNAVFDVYFFGGLDLGIGAESGNLEAYLIKIETKAGPYGALTIKAPPLCVEYELGGRVKAEVKAFKLGNFTLLNFETKLDWPGIANGASPANCDAEGKVRLGYVISGTPYYSLNASASTELVDVYDAGKGLLNAAGSGRIRLDLGSTVGVKGRRSEFEVEMLSGNTGGATFFGISQAAAGSASSYAYADFNTGNSTYGDVIRFKISAFDPANRVATEAVRRVEIRIEPAMSAAPKYQHYVSTNGAEGYLANYWYGSTGALLTSNQIKNGYLEVAAGDKFVFASEYNNILNNLDTGKDITINSVADRTNLRPQRLALLSKLDKAGSEQFFNFVELANVVISSVNISPFQPTVGNLATFTVNGDGLPANLAVNIPNCSSPVEVRSAGNIAKNNYATGLRVFTCTPFASGENLTATFGAYSKLFTIPSQACPAGQTLVNGVCTAVTAVTNITPTTATLNTATVFTVTGTNLPLTAILDVAGATCQNPGSYIVVGVVATGFSQTCTSTTTGVKVITVKAPGGTVIDNTRSVNVILAPAMTGSFSVPASLQNGTQFTVPAGASGCNFTATGTWSFGATTTAVGVGPTSAIAGSYTWIMASSPAYSLVGVRAGTPFYIGNTKTVLVQGGESIYLFMNDAIGTFGDNSGALSVSYSCSNTPATTGSFTVASNTIPGATFQVPAGATSCQLSATGTWSAGPNAPISAQTADGVVGGNALDLVGRGVPLSSAPVNSLVAQHSATGIWELVGSSKTIAVSPQENLRFMMNDATDGGYTDGNTGSLTVSYSCN